MHSSFAFNFYFRPYVVGKALADPTGEFNIYRRVIEHAPLAAEVGPGT